MSKPIAALLLSLRNYTRDLKKESQDAPEVMKRLGKIFAIMGEKIQNVSDANQSIVKAYGRYGCCQNFGTPQHRLPHFFDESVHFPFLLKCGHAICQECLGNSLTDERLGNHLYKARCPLCKGAKQFCFPADYFIIPSLDRLRVMAQIGAPLSDDDFARADARQEDVEKIHAFIPVGDRASQLAVDFLSGQGKYGSLAFGKRSKRSTRKSLKR